MAIYRGEGGAGDATADASNAAALADSFADAANASAGQAAASAASALAAKVAAELAETNAELAETNAETAEAAAEAVLTDAGFIVVAADLQGTDTIGTVATNIANVNAVGNNIANVNAVNANATNINAVNANATNINTVAGISSNVTTVATNNANVTTVAGSIASVNTNATNIANINQNAANIVAIQGASANATAAAASATAAAGSATSASASAAAASAVALGNEPVRHSVRPSLLLDFANTKTLDPRITFTRASTATFYDGKTVAKAEENLFRYSQEFDNANWAKTRVTVTANATTAPDGTTTAELITATASTGDTKSISVVTASLSGQTVSSIFAKAGTHNFIQLAQGGDAQHFANFDLSTGTVGTVGTKTTASIISVGNGWYRCIAITDGTSAVTALTILMAASNTAARLSGFTTVGTETIELWGAQLEQRSSVTAYTPTTTAPITNYIPALQTAAAGVARFEHNPTTGESLGLEIEEQKTNLFTYSDDLSNAIWTKSLTTVDSNTVVAPDGTLTADKSIPSTGANTVYQAISVTSGTSYSFSVYAKMAGYRYLVLRNTFAGVSGDNVSFDLLDGVVQRNVSGVTSTITPVGNNWYRCSCSWASGATGSSNFQVKAASEAVSTSSATLTGSYNSFDGIYIWGAQLEAGAFATSYIPTVASQVTRSSDAASMTGTNFSSWYRADEGTLYVEAQPASRPDLDSASNGTLLTAVSFGDALTNQYSVLTRTEAGSRVNRAAAYFRSPIVVSVPETADNNTYPNGSFTKFATAMKAYDYAFSANGGTIVSSAIPDAVIGTRLNIGSNYNSVTLNGYIKKLAYYPKRLTNAELQSLTVI